MPFRPVRTTRTTQPQGAARVDWSNPLALDLGGLFDARQARELVCDQPATNRTSLPVVRRIGMADDFSGSANQQYAHRPGYAATGPLTIFALCEIDALSNYSAIIGKQGTSTSNAPYEWRLGNGPTEGNCLLIRASASGFSAKYAGTAIVAAAANTPQTLVVRSASGDLTINQEAFVGRTKSTMNVSGSSSATTATDNGASVWIGRRYDGATQLDGRIYFVAVWGRALSDLEIYSLADNPWQLFAPEPRRIWVPAASTGIPALSAATVTSITATTARPRVTVTF